MFKAPKIKRKEPLAETELVRSAINELVYQVLENNSQPDFEVLKIIATQFKKIQTDIEHIIENDSDIKNPENMAAIKLSNIKTAIAKNLGYTQKRGTKIKAKKRGYDTARRYHNWVSTSPLLHTVAMPKEKAKEIFEDEYGVPKSTLENYYRIHKKGIQLDICFEVLRWSTKNHFEKN